MIVFLFGCRSSQAIFSKWCGVIEIIFAVKSKCEHGSDHPAIFKPVSREAFDQRDDKF